MFRKALEKNTDHKSKNQTYLVRGQGREKCEENAKKVRK